jgi:GTP cyclohydrolase FolE2
MNAPERFFLPDVQSTADHRRLAIQRVGVEEPRVAEWKVASENFESIHNHSAYAELIGRNVWQ